MRIHAIMFPDDAWDIVVEIAKRKGLQGGTLVRMITLEHIVEPEQKRRRKEGAAS